jgi:orotidine-5'-phosphate decarboxylase
MTSPRSRSLEPVAVALDTPKRETFSHWCALFGPHVGVLKVGLEAFVRWGPESVTEARQWGRQLFLDLKLHDIPNTVRGAVSAAADLGVDYLTVHAAGGPRMMAAAREAAGDRIKLLGVTLLTHLDDESLQTLDLAGSSTGRVSRWTTLARAAGCAGVVCSPLEVARLRAENPSPFLLVTPGIRGLHTTGDDDQRRTATPDAALRAGADLLVIGRPLTRAVDPEAALRQLAKTLESAGKP